MKHSLGILAVLLWSSVQIFAQTDWYNPFGKGEIPVQGRCWNEEIGAKYHRLPDRAEKVVRKALWDLSCQSAGLYIKFTTNASKIQVKYTVTSGFSMPHMPATGVSGVDLYMIDAYVQALWCAGKYSFGDTVRYTYDNLTYPRQSDKGNEFCLYLPLYNGVNLMEIGVPAGSSVKEEACGDLWNIHCAGSMRIASRYGLDQYSAKKARFSCGQSGIFRKRTLRGGVFQTAG